MKRLFCALLVAFGAACGGAGAQDVAPALGIEDLAPGAGRAAAPGDRVTVHYDGRLLDGTPFDSSRDRGQTFSFVLGRGQTIRGWEEGIQGMKVGGLRRLTVPPEYGYGGRDLGIIPPYSTLVFDVELLGLD